MWHVSVLDTVDSTQRYLRQLYDRDPGLAEGYGVRAVLQTGGYGRYGRAWQSEHGDLAFSFLLRPLRPMQEWGTLSLVVGLALRQCLDDGDDLMLKWPNDVLIGGYKCAGILCEVHHDTVMVGVGVNLTCKDNPTFSRLETRMDAQGLMDRFLQDFERLYVRWSARGFSGLKGDWLSFAHERGAPLSVKQGDHTVHGTFEAVGDDGALLFKDEKGAIKTITAGELTIGSV